MYYVRSEFENMPLYEEGTGSNYYNSAEFLNRTLDKKIEERKEDNKNISFNIGHDRLQDIDRIKSTLKYLKEKDVDFSKMLVGITIYADDDYLTSKELEKLIEIEDFVNKNNGTLTIVAEDIFSLDEIIKTNSKLEEQVNYINSLTVPDENNRPLNEFEKFLMAYNFCTNRKYNEDEENKSNSRYLTSIMNSDKIVCVGYANLLKEMCSRLGIECFTYSVSISNKQDEYLGGHQNNIVSLNGKLYYADACWDCVNENDKGVKSYNYCLIPIKDVKNFKYCNIKYNKDFIFKDLANEKMLAQKFLKELETSVDEEISEECKDFILKYSDFIDGNILQEKSASDPIFMSYNERVKLRQKNKLKQIQKFLNKYEYGEAFSYDDFYNAIYNINRAEGMSSQKAEGYTNRIMELNEDESKHIFTNGATNCFAVGHESGYEI